MRYYGIIGTTIIGGAFFLLPIVVLALVIGKALQFSTIIAKPLEQFFPLDRLIGFAIVDLLAIMGLLIVCYFAGLLASVEYFKKYASRAQDLLLGTLPGYAFAKTMASAFTQADDGVGTMKPILVRLDEMHQIAFEVERTPKGNVVVYLPGAPNPWSGTVAYFTPDRVSGLDMKPSEAIKLIRVLGRGSGKFAEATEPAQS